MIAQSHIDAGPAITASARLFRYVAVVSLGSFVYFSYVSPNSMIFANSLSREKVKLVENLEARLKFSCAGQSGVPSVELLSACEIGRHIVASTRAVSHEPYIRLVEWNSTIGKELAPDRLHYNGEANRINAKIAERSKFYYTFCGAALVVSLLAYLVYSWLSGRSQRANADQTGGKL
ncbi:MAG: hypothetical protein ACRCWF_12985 [Beijerinckiaceae bacterium]